MTPLLALFTHTQKFAWVGLTEEQAKEQGHEVKTGQFSLAANGRALAAGEGQGFIKAVADAKTDRFTGYACRVKRAQAISFIKA